VGGGGERGEGGRRASVVGGDRVGLLGLLPPRAWVQASAHPSPAHPDPPPPRPRPQVTHNRSLDGVLDTISSRTLTDAGPLQLIDADGASSDDELLPPSGGGAASDAAGRLGIGAAAAAAKRRPAARVRALALAPTGAHWAAATTEGVLLYALDSGAAFDPTDLSEGLTPAAFRAALGGRAFVRALLIALRLGDEGLVKHGVLCTPPGQVRRARAGRGARGWPRAGQRRRTSPGQAPNPCAAAACLP
jgi:hypothetical protein